LQKAHDIKDMGKHYELVLWHKNPTLRFIQC
jgi:hypothetical protein